MKRAIVQFVFVVLMTVLPVRAASVLVECENFKDPGGWDLDQQSMDQMGSPYLLAHGLGVPVKDAVTTVVFPETGEYRVWVRTRDWVGPWKTPETPAALKATGTPGEFQLIFDGKTLPVIFGKEGADWHWQDGGKVTVDKKEITLALHDLQGFDGRCDAVLFTTDEKLVPPNTLEKMGKFRRKMLGQPEKPEDGGEFDLVVAGGGIAGTCAALSAARQGLKVALIQDRPVLGGNGSSEVRVWLNGEVNKDPYPRIGDIVNELEPKQRAHPGTAEMYEDDRRIALVRAETNITLFLDYRANEVKVSFRRIKSVTAQNTRTGARVRLAGRFFADCTGDGVIGFLAGADYEVSEKGKMGASNVWKVFDQADKKQVLKCECKDKSALALATEAGKVEAPFPRCPWAIDLSDKPFPGRANSSGQWGKKTPLEQLGVWFWENGFDRDSVADIEVIRDLNLRAMFGAWDALKNVDKLYPNHRIEWAAYIAGKRESRRLLGDVVLNQEDLVSGRKWDDGCFPCTWSIDLHVPEAKYGVGFEGSEFISKANHGKYPKPYWVPYRCLYSRNIKNLFMAGRDISVTHEALGPVRVMRTCGAMGEIVGMAASICRKHNASPRDVYRKYLDELKQLMTVGAGKKQGA